MWKAPTWGQQTALFWSQGDTLCTLYTPRDRPLAQNPHVGA